MGGGRLVIATLRLQEMRARDAAVVLVGLALAAAAPFAAPSSPILPGPDSAPAYVFAVAALGAAFALGLAFPLPALYGLVVVTVLEGAVRKWVLNDVTIYLIKDFLLLGIYAAVLPSLTRRELRRPWWVLAPLAFLLLLAVLHLPLADSLSEAAIGFRSYAIYVPLLWVAPRLLDTPPRLRAFLLAVIALGVANSLLATAQALTGGQWLNKTAPGVIPALFVVDGTGILRPTGTMLQVGTLSAFLLLPFVCAFGLVVGTRRGRLLAVGVAGIALLSWGIPYSGSRVLFATAVLGAAGMLAVLLWQRRFLVAAAVPAAVLFAYLVLAYQPLLGGAVREGSDSHFLRNETYTYVDYDGKVKTGTVSIGRGDPAAVASHVGRASGVGVGGGGSSGGAGGGETKEYEKPRNRIELQIDLLRQEGLVGHGTGTETLGTQHLQRKRSSAGRESEYVRVAHELGLAALAVWMWFLAAVWYATFRAALVVDDQRRSAAIAALGAATLVPLLTALTFAFEYPAVATLYYALTGLALAWYTQAADRVTAAEQGGAARS